MLYSGMRGVLDFFGQRHSGRARIVVSAVLLTIATFLIVEGGLAPRVRTDAPPPVPLTGNPIVAENKKAGTTSWRIDHITGGALQGFASRTSVPPNGHITLFVTSAYPTYSVDVYRMGWYHGTGARLVYARHGLTGLVQPDATTDGETRMVEAHWSPSLTLTVADDWTTGTYIAKLSGPQGQGSYIPFVVREGRERAPIVFQSSVTTWQAYNIWGGHSLYFGIESGGGEAASLRSKVVSFDRPYGYGSGAADYFGLEFPLVQWLEENGYNVGYATDLDTHEDPLLLTGRRAFLSLGHDEYWSTAMRDHVEAAVKQGVNLAFFGANAMYRHIRFESSPLGLDRREINYRSTSDPITEVDPKEATVQWRDYPIERPEDAVMGAMYECNPVHGDSIVYDPLTWLFTGTRLTTDDRVKGIVGDEYDRVFPDTTHPKRLWVLFRSPVDCGNATSVQDTTFARFPSGAGVFDAGTSRFLCVFSGCPTAPRDERMQRLVRNLIDSYLAPTPPRPEPDPRAFTTFTRHVVVQYESSTTVRSPAIMPLPTPEPPATPSWTQPPMPTPGPETPAPTPRHLGIP